MKTRRPQRTLIEEVIAGAFSGLVATIPMTITMFVVQRMLPRREQTTQEPRQITDDMLHKSNLDDDVSEQGKDRLSVAAHFTYGAGTGMIYALAGRLLPLPAGLRGPVYGFFVWAASYAGWLPAVKTLPPPHRRPLGRNMLLIVSHLVWGVALEPLSALLLNRKWLRRAWR